MGDRGDIVSAEKRRKNSRTSSRYHREPVLLLTLPGLPLHRSPLSMCPPSSRDRPAHIPQKGEGARIWGYRSNGEGGEESGGGGGGERQED